MRTQTKHDHLLKETVPEFTTLYTYKRRWGMKKKKIITRGLAGKQFTGVNRRTVDTYYDVFTRLYEGSPASAAL